VIERVWEWHFAGSAEALWPVLADTARFNEAIGLPRYAVSETPLPDGRVRRTGSARRNLAARLQNESQGGDIVLSEAMAAEPGMMAEFDRLHHSEETALVKGFSQPIRLRRIAPPA